MILLIRYFNNYFSEKEPEMKNHFAAHKHIYIYIYINIYQNTSMYHDSKKP